MKSARTKRIEQLLADVQRRNRPPVPEVLYGRAEGGYEAEGVKYDSLAAFVARHGQKPFVLIPARPKGTQRSGVK